MRVTEQDRERIVQAIAAAEARTSGEIFCVLAREVSSYRDVSLAWAAAAALILPIGLIPFGFEASWLPGFSDGWKSAHLAAHGVGVGHAVTAYAIIQSAVFLLVFLVTSIPVVRRLATPRVLRRARVRKAAMEQFLAHGIHVTAERTGVLIFAALGEHHVEVVADEGIHSKVDPSVWADAVDGLARGLKRGDPGGGFVTAIDLCGEVLARHFPPSADNPNEIADRLVLI